MSHSHTHAHTQTQIRVQQCLNLFVIWLAFSIVAVVCNQGRWLLRNICLQFILVNRLYSPESSDLCTRLPYVKAHSFMISQLIFCYVREITSLDRTDLRFKNACRLAHEQLDGRCCCRSFTLNVYSKILSEFDYIYLLHCFKAVFSIGAKCTFWFHTCNCLWRTARGTLEPPPRKLAKLCVRRDHHYTFVYSRPIGIVEHDLRRGEGTKMKNHA